VKERNAKETLSCSDDLIVGFIQRPFRSLREIFIQVNVKNASKIFEFDVDTTETPYTLQLREEKLGQNDRCQPISNLDCLWTRYENEAEFRDIN
jgi:hypothetical protein